MSDPQLPSNFRRRSPWSDPDTIERQAPHLAVWEALRKGSVLAWSCVGFVVIAIVVTKLLFFTMAQTIKVERALVDQLPPHFASPVGGEVSMELLLGIDADCRITFNLEPVGDLRAVLKQVVQENQGNAIVATIAQDPDADPKAAYERLTEILNALAAERVTQVTITTE
ncbi:MAG: ExbD/TolR family protein [Prosthecobacter sp.]